jgi:GTPase
VKIPKGAKQVAVSSLATKLNNLVDVVGDSRVRITIVEGIAAGKIIARIVLLVATNEKRSKITVYMVLFLSICWRWF